MPRLRLPLSAVRTRPLEHQYRAAKFGADREAVAYFMDPGTGKSLVGLMLTELWDCKRVLILCPAVAVGVWELQLEEHAPELSHRVDIRIMSYDSARGRQSRKMTRYQSKHKEREISKWKPDTVICDEGHRLKGRGTKQSRMVRRLGRSAAHRVVLTGTPLDGGYVDLWAIFDFLQPGLLRHKFKDFQDRYCRMGGYRGYQVIGYRNVDEMMRRISSITFTQKLEDAIDLKEPRHTVVPVTPSKKLATAYQTLHKTLETTLDGDPLTVTNSLTKVLRLHQMCGGFYNENLVDRFKINAFLDLVSDWRKPYVVVARFLPEIDLIVKELSKTKRVGEISGRTRKTRTETVAKFQKGKLDVVVIQAQSGISITLTRATELVFYSCDQSFITHKQNLHRILRIGIEGRASYYYMVASINHSLDRAIRYSHSRKKSLTNLLHQKGIQFLLGNDYNGDHDERIHRSSSKQTPLPSRDGGAQPGEIRDGKRRNRNHRQEKGRQKGFRQGARKGRTEEDRRQGR